jgi:hypothetical protein
MTTFDRLEPRFAELLDELAPATVPEYLSDLLQRSATARQGRAWSSVDRWVPAGATLRRGRMGRPIRSRLAVVALAAITTILVTSIGLLSSRPPTVADPAVGASVAPSVDASPAASPNQSPRPSNVSNATGTTALGSGNWSYGSSTRLADGRVLILGFDTGAMRARLWDPATEAITDAGTVEGNTFGSHSATLLPDGRVLIAGGWHKSMVEGPIGSALTWDPETGEFTPTGALVTPRYGHLAVGLDGGRVLVLGGNGVRTAEIYEPDAGRFMALDVRSELDGYFVASRLADGRVLVLGAAQDGRCTEIWDVSPGAPSMSERVQGGCQARSATLLANGRVLVASSAAAYSDGSQARTARITATLFDPTRGTYTPAGSMSTTVDRSVAVGMADGRVLFAGGYGPDGTTTAVAETWNVAAWSFTASGSLSVARAEPDMTLLDDGRILVVGGWDVQVSVFGEDSSPIPSLEVFDPSDLEPGAPVPNLPGSRRLVIQVNNMTKAPIDLLVAEDGSPMGKVVGTAQPSTIPPMMGQDVAFTVPAGEEWAIFVDPGPGDDGLITARDVSPDATGAIPFTIWVDEGVEPLVVGPDGKRWFGRSPANPPTP